MNQEDVNYKLRDIYLLGEKIARQEKIEFGDPLVRNYNLLMESLPESFSREDLIKYYEEIVKPLEESIDELRKEKKEFGKERRKEIEGLKKKLSEAIEKIIREIDY